MLTRSFHPGSGRHDLAYSKNEGTIADPASWTNTGTSAVNVDVLGLALLVEAHDRPLKVSR